MHETLPDEMNHFLSGVGTNTFRTRIMPPTLRNEHLAHNRGVNSRGTKAISVAGMRRARDAP